MTATPGSAKEILTAFIRGTTPDPVIVSPIFTEAAPGEWARLPWDTPQDDPRMVEAKLAWARTAGFPPVIKHEIGSLDLFLPRQEVLAETPGKLQIKYSFQTPRGELSSIVVRVQDSAQCAKPWCEDLDDILKMVWVLENLDYGPFRAKLRRLMDQIGDRGLLCVNLGHPIGWFGTLDQLVFLIHDHPEAMREAVAATLEVLKQTIDEAAAEGVVSFFVGELGSNIFSPELTHRWLVPQARALRDHCHTRGAIYYLHVCGRMQKSLDLGFFHEILPDWLEGFEASLLGDIENLGTARKHLPPTIVLKGNLNIEFLEKSNPRDIQRAVARLHEQIQGYRHIISGACSILRNTPLANLQALSATS